MKKLSRLSAILSRQTKLLLYKTIIVPLIDYADIVYEGINVKDRQVLERLQSSSMMIILNADKSTHIHDRQQQLSLLPLDVKHKHHLCHQTYKGLNCLEQGMLNVKKCRLDLCKRN